MDRVTLSGGDVAMSPASRYPPQWGLPPRLGNTPALAGELRCHIAVLRGSIPDHLFLLLFVHI